jgi:hypothetical protein
MQTDTAKLQGAFLQLFIVMHKKINSLNYIINLYLTVL